MGNTSINSELLNAPGTGTFFSDPAEIRFETGYALRYALTDETTGADALLAGSLNVETINFDTKANTGAGDYIVLHDVNDQPWAVAASILGIAEVTTITAVADVSDSLDATFILLQDTDGSVGVWIDTDNSGTTIPAGAAAADRAIEVTTIVTDDTDVTIGGLLRTAIGADSKFSTSGSGADCIVTNVDIEPLTDAADGDTGFGFVTDTQGSVLGAEPTGAVWLSIGAAFKAQADISGDTTDIEVAATFELAFDGISGFSAVLTSSDVAANGTMTMTTTTRGAIIDGIEKDEDDSGVGSIVINTSTVGIDSAFATATDIITSVAHGMITGAKGQFTSSGTLPAGISLATDYFIIFVDVDNYKIAASLQDAIDDVPVNFTNQGQGMATHTFTPIALSGTVTFQASVNDDGTAEEYVDLATPAPNAFTGAETAFANIPDAYYRFVRLKFEVTDGTVGGSAIINGKG